MGASDLAAHDLGRGFRLIAGVDEAGGGCWAGPIMAAGVLFDLERVSAGAGREFFEELNDSKRLADSKLERLARAVFAHAEAVCVVSSPPLQIDRIGFRLAHMSCLKRALHGVGERAELRLVDGDGHSLGDDAPDHEQVVKGDGTSATIAAASIVVKVTRDRLMTRLAERYPGYSFEVHHGYGTKIHEAAILELGPSPVHRLSAHAKCLAEWRASQVS